MHEWAQLLDNFQCNSLFVRSSLDGMRFSSFSLEFFFFYNITLYLLDNSTSYLLIQYININSDFCIIPFFTYAVLEV